MGHDEHPSGDRRFTVLDVAMKRHHHQPGSLIEVLHAAQGHFGFLGPDVLLYVAHGLKLPPSRVYGVATFYHLFALRPPAEHSCVVCTGTACFVSGARGLLSAAEESCRRRAAEAADGKTALLTARCIGACGLAPAVIYDNIAAGHQTPEQVARRLQDWS